MRTDHVTDEKKAALVRELAGPYVGSHQRELQRLQRRVAARLVGAGFCAFGCVYVVVSAVSPGFGLKTPWYLWLTFFSIGGAALLATAWAQFTLHHAKVRAGERAALALLFERWAKEDRTFTANEIVVLLRSLPDPLDVWAVTAASNAEQELR